MRHLYPKEEKLAHRGQKGPQSPLYTRSVLQGAGPYCQVQEQGLPDAREELVGVLVSAPSLDALCLFSQTQFPYLKIGLEQMISASFLLGGTSYGCLIFESGTKLHHLKCSLQVISLYLLLYHFMI